MCPRKLRMIIVGGAMSLLAACVTAVGTNYAPADAKGYGFSEKKIESNRYRITFAGDGATPPAVVKDYALLRAAELTIENGYDWFRVVSREMGQQVEGGVGIGAGVGGGSYGRRSGVGVGVSGDLGRVGSKRLYTSWLEIIMGKGERPSDGETYDAREIAASIRARIAASGPQ